ncbi:MAG: nucleoside deaminase [Clostridia bacterium]|nr:nucleoside deaminase [Clostridia bacterium]
MRVEFFMARALELARQAAEAGEVPVGALVVSPAGAIIAEGQNRMCRDADPGAHAEVLALRAACAYIKGTESVARLEGCTLFSTLEPCTMCAGAAVLYRVSRIIYGAADPRAEETVLPVACGGIMEKESQMLLADFFKNRR